MKILITSLSFCLISMLAFSQEKTQITTTKPATKGVNPAINVTPNKQAIHPHLAPSNTNVNKPAPAKPVETTPAKTNGTTPGK